MPRYLTDEWIDAANRALGASESLAAAARDVCITVQQLVTGGPHGDIVFHVDIDHGRVGVASGEAVDPTVTFIQDWATATTVARGEASAQGAFMTGKIRVRGDLTTLIEHAGIFEGIDDALAELRLQTDFGNAVV